MNKHLCDSAVSMIRRAIEPEAADALIYYIHTMVEAEKAESNYHGYEKGLLQGFVVGAGAIMLVIALASAVGIKL